MLLTQEQVLTITDREALSVNKIKSGGHLFTEKTISKCPPNILVSRLICCMCQQICECLKRS